MKWILYVLLLSISIQVATATGISFIPDMTNNSRDGFQVWTWGDSGDFDGFKAFNHSIDQANSWEVNHPATDSEPASVCVATPIPYRVVNWSIIWNNVPALNHSGTMKLYGSTNNVTWDEISTSSGANGTNNVDNVPDQEKFFNFYCINQTSGSSIFFTSLINLTPLASDQTVEVKDEMTDARLSVASLVELLSDTETHNLTFTGVGTFSNVSGGEYTARTTASGFVTRTQILNIPLVNGNHTLYVIPTTNSTTLNVNVKDEGFNNLANATVEALRYFPADNEYKEVESIKTDFAGNGQLHLEQDGQFYRFKVFHLGILRSETVGTVITSQHTANGLNFQIGTTTDTTATYGSLAGIAGSVVFNNNTNNTLFSYTDNSGTLTQACLELLELDNRFQFITVNSSCSTSSSSTIIVPLPVVSGNHSYIARGLVETTASPTQRVILDTVSITISTIQDTFGNLGLYLAATIVAVFGTIALFNPKTAMVTGALGVGVAVQTGLITLGIGVVTGILLIAIVIGLVVKNAPE